MKKNLFITILSALLTLASCTDKPDNTAEHIAFLNSFYSDFFVLEEDNLDANAEKYLPHCSDQIIQELKDQYEYDCEDGECYAWWIFRGGAQAPGSGDITVVKAEDDWYEVSCDGWYGTVIKVRVEGTGDDLMITGVINPECGSVK